MKTINFKTQTLGWMLSSVKSQWWITPGVRNEVNW